MHSKCWFTSVWGFEAHTKSDSAYVRILTNVMSLGSNLFTSQLAGRTYFPWEYNDVEAKGFNKMKQTGLSFWEARGLTLHYVWDIYEVNEWQRGTSQCLLTVADRCWPLLAGPATWAIWATQRDAVSGLLPLTGPLRFQHFILLTTGLRKMAPLKLD